MKLGADVYRPLGEGGRYDLILDVVLGSFVFSANGLLR
jgi:hypothetical protein